MVSFVLHSILKSVVADSDGGCFQMQIDAHVGGVNDLAFSHPNKQLCVITCGDDKTIKVTFYL